ncbi:MAG TPA: hypothetical protein V6C81_17780 [Planktothrix sp.]|jgi:PAS domain-containing protein
MPSDKELVKLCLEASVKQICATIESLPIGIVKLSPTGAIKSIDKEAERLLGFFEGELKGSSITIILEEGGFELTKQLAQLETAFDAPLLIRTKDGAHIAILAAVVRDTTALHENTLIFSFVVK